jgi:hypothetical protein
VKKKYKLYDIIVVGSGLSSLSFIQSYLEKKNNLDVLSPHNIKLKFKDKIKNNLNNHIFKILPPQMLGKEKTVKDYFFYNQIKIKKNCKLFGSLEFGGLSNYWGLQIDKDIFSDISHLSKKTSNAISKSFLELFSKLNLLGQFKLDNKTIYNSFKKDDFVKKNLMFNDINLFNQEPILAYQKKAKNFFNLSNINEEKDKLAPKNFHKKYLKKKRINFHNFFVKKINKNSKFLELICSDGKIEKKYYTKKLVLGASTIMTTKLLLDYLNIKKEVKINHHPRLFTLYFSRSKWKNNMKFQPSHFHLKSKKQKDLFVADFRPGNNIIIDAIVNFKKFLFPFKFILNALRQNMIFSNIFLHPKFGNLFIKYNKKENVFMIYSKNKDLKNIFSKISQLILKFLKRSKQFFPFHINYFPGFGADFHYFGTFNIGNGKSKLSVNEKCQLKADKRIYLIDGSIFNFKKNKYPLGVIMANARRVAKLIK